MMGFKGLGCSTVNIKGGGVSEQWWDLKVCNKKAALAPKCVLANNDGI